MMLVSVQQEPSHAAVSWHDGKEALAHFEQMCQNDKIVVLMFVCFSHVGLVDEGLCYIDCMGSYQSIFSTM
jgi:hypothetical protein